MIRVLFVCTGNICRSPTAEAVFRHYVEMEGLSGVIECDSAGTHGYHIGDAPDARAIRSADRRGIPMDGLSARKVRQSDFDQFQWILAMDEGHYTILEEYKSNGGSADVRLFMDFAPERGVKDVPDPYYGGTQDFEHALDLVEAGAKGLLDAVRKDLGH